MLPIISLRAFEDNYIWVMVDDRSLEAIVVDPGDAIPVLDFLKEKNLTLNAILVTHKHHDHTGGISDLLSAYPHAIIYSSKEEHVPHTTHRVTGNDEFTLNNIIFKVIDIPGHTTGHIAYYAKPALFCGDTLFTNGCGRIFEGTALQMLTSLKKLMSLPLDTHIYCGHEYTLANIEFALTVEPHNIDLLQRYTDAFAMREQNKPSVPSTLALEKATNPFLRCQTSSVIEAVSHYAKKKLISEVDVFSTLREWKNKA